MMPSEIVVPMLVLQAIFWAVSVAAAFSVGRWYQRRRAEGMEKGAIIDLAKDTGEAKLVALYESKVGEVKALAEKIKAMRGG
jgi:hypothetical protein